MKWSLIKDGISVLAVNIVDKEFKKIRFSVNDELQQHTPRVSALGRSPLLVDGISAFAFPLADTQTRKTRGNLWPRAETQLALFYKAFNNVKK